MLKTGLVIFLLAIELFVYYSFGGLASYPLRILGYFSLLFWYYSKRKNVFHLTDKLFLASSFFPMISPIPVYVFGVTHGKTLELALIMISYFFIIRIYQTEGSKIILFDKQHTFFNVFIPYILMPCAFFAAVILPLTNAKTVVLTGIYSLQMIYMVVLSAFLPYQEKSKFYISLAMCFVVLASGANAYRMYISHFSFDYGVVRLSTTLFRLFLLFGMLSHVNQRVGYSVLA